MLMVISLPPMQIVVFLKGLKVLKGHAEDQSSPAFIHLKADPAIEWTLLATDRGNTECEQARMRTK